MGMAQGRLLLIELMDEPTPLPPDVFPLPEPMPIPQTASLDIAMPDRSSEVGVGPQVFGPKPDNRRIVIHIYDVRGGREDDVYRVTVLP